MSAFFHTQPKEVRVEDGLTVCQTRKMGAEGSPFYYCVAEEGSWKDWVDLAKAIIQAEEKRGCKSQAVQAERGWVKCSERLPEERLYVLVFAPVYQNTYCACRRDDGFAETGCNASDNLVEWFGELSSRLRRVRVCCGDWSRICGPSVTVKQGLTGIFLDPPYSDEAARTDGLYREDCGKVAHLAREWAIEASKSPLMRVALCGYEGEYEMPSDWEKLEWKTPGGYGSQSISGENGNAYRERIWFSPGCLSPITQKSLGI